MEKFDKEMETTVVKSPEKKIRDEKRAILEDPEIDAEVKRITEVKQAEEVAQAKKNTLDSFPPEEKNEQQPGNVFAKFQNMEDFSNDPEKYASALMQFFKEYYGKTGAIGNVSKEIPEKLVILTALAETYKDDKTRMEKIIGEIKNGKTDIEDEDAYKKKLFGGKKLRSTDDLTGDVKIYQDNYSTAVESTKKFLNGTDSKGRMLNQFITKIISGEDITENAEVIMEKAGAILKNLDPEKFNNTEDLTKYVKEQAKKAKNAIGSSIRIHG